MKTFRRIIKLLPPAFAMRIWMQRKYGIKIRPLPWGGVVGFAVSLLPYAFTAALSMRVDSDSRLLKYFMPYGKMKKLVYLAYRMKVGNDDKDHGVIGAFRFIMPYGLVLWWDAEDERIKASPRRNKKNTNATSSRIESCKVGSRISEKERQALQNMDKVAAMTLRLMILNAEKSR